MENSRNVILLELEAFLQQSEDNENRLVELEELKDTLQGHLSYYLRWMLNALQGSPSLAVVRLVANFNQDYSTDELQTCLNLCRTTNWDLALKINQREINVVKSIIIAYALNCLEYWRYRINPLTDDFNLLLPEPTTELRSTVFIESLHHYANEVLSTEGDEIDEFRIQHAESIFRLRMKVPSTENQYAEAVEEIFANWTVYPEEKVFHGKFMKRLMVLTNIICDLVERLEAPILLEKTDCLITTLAKVLGPFLNIEHIKAKDSSPRRVKKGNTSDTVNQLTSSQLEKLQQLIPCKSHMFKGVWH